MKKVIFVTPNLTNGGAERVTAVLANELAEQGWAVEVAYMKDSFSVYPLSPKVKSYDLYSDGNKAGRIVRKILKLRKLMKENTDVAFVAMLPYETLYTYLASWGLPIRIVYSLRNDPANMNGKLDRFIKKRIYPKADRIVFQTEEARAYFPEKVWKKGVVIPNPISAKLPERYKGKRNREIVTVGRLEKQKNYPLLLHSFVAIHQKYPEWKLRIFGQGTLEEDLRNLCTRLKIENSVEFCGFRENVIEEINRSGMFVLSSDYEGISNAMLEALATGVPCICTDCPVGGARMVIQDHENGLLVPVGDERKLSEAMLELIQYPQLADRLSCKAMEIRDRLSGKKIAEAWGRIL